jgi:hypothetical protein
MSAQPVEGPDDGQQASPGQQPALSVLEEALRQALATVARERVFSCIATALPIDTGAGHGLTPRGRPQLGKVQKVSVSMPAELVDLIRARAGAGGFSRYVTDAAQEQVRLDLLAELSAELEAEFGPVDEDQVKQAMREWPDFAEE